MTDLRTLLADKENIDTEVLRKTSTDLQHSSLKLFEMAYKRVSNTIYLVYNISNHFN